MKPFAEMSFVELFAAAAFRKVHLQHPVKDGGGLALQCADRRVADGVPSGLHDLADVGQGEDLLGDQSVQQRARNETASGRAT